MSGFGKRGVSDVVSTVLIILLVVAAVAIVGAIVLRTVNKAGPQVQNSVSCEQLQVVSTRCTYTTGNTPTVLVNRRAGDASLVLSNLTFIFYKGANSETRYGSSFPNILETKSYTVGAELLPSLGASVASPDSVAIAASIKGANGVSVPCALGAKVSCTKVVTTPVSPPGSDHYTLSIVQGNPGGSVTSNIGGISCFNIVNDPLGFRGTCSAVLDANAAVTLTAAPQDGGYAGGLAEIDCTAATCCSGSSCTISMTSDRTIMAEFTEAK